MELDPGTFGKVLLAFPPLRSLYSTSALFQCASLFIPYLRRSVFDVFVILDFAAVDLYTVQKEVIELLKGRTLVGHALHNDLKVRGLWHILYSCDWSNVFILNNGCLCRF